MMDQPGKRNYFNFAGENSDYGAKFGHSCHFKDIANKLPSCEDCMQKLSMSIDVESCSKYLNWNVMNAECSKECIENNGGMAKRPCKLSLNIQKILSKSMFDKIIEGKVNKQTAMKMLKPLNFSGDATNLIVDAAFSERERLNGDQNSPSYQRPEFVAQSRDNLDFHKATSCPMHLLFLGVTNSAIGLVLLLANVFDVDKVVLQCVMNNMEQLLAAGIDFGPNAMLRDEKTSGWIASDYLRLSKVMPWVFKDMDNIMKLMFQENEDIDKHTSKMCRNYLMLHNQVTPETLKEKRASVKKTKSY